MPWWQWVHTQTWWQWVNTAVHFVYQMAIIVVPIVLAYEGAQLVAAGEARGKALRKLLGGLGLCLILGSVSLWFAFRMQKLAVQLFDLDQAARPTPREWGTEFTPEEREMRSRILAAIEFTRSGAIVDYVNRDGNWLPYNPTAEDIKLRETQVASKAEMNAAARQLLSKGFTWYGMGLIAAVAGWMSGHLRRKKSDETVSTP